MKKILLGLGSVTAIIAPVTAVVACGDDNKDFDFRSDLAKVINAQSSKSKTILNTDVGAKEAKAVVTAADLGITDPKLSEGVSVAYAVKAKYDDDTGVIVVTATLTKGEAKSWTKTLTVTAKLNEADWNKIQANNFQALKDKLKNDVLKIVNDKASIIAKRIKDAATLLAETGIDLTSLDKNSTYAISATGNADGKVIITVVMTTEKATTHFVGEATREVTYKSDAVIDSTGKNKL